MVLLGEREKEKHKKSNPHTTLFNREKTTVDYLHCFVIELENKEESNQVKYFNSHTATSKANVTKLTKKYQEPGWGCSVIEHQPIEPRGQRFNS